jgi:hypothetical protein
LEKFVLRTGFLNLRFRAFLTHMSLKTTEFSSIPLCLWRGEDGSALGG